MPLVKQQRDIPSYPSLPVRLYISQTHASTIWAKQTVTGYITYGKPPSGSIRVLWILYSILFYPITFEGSRTTQMTWQQPLSTLSCFISCLSWAGKVHSCPFFNIVFPPLFCIPLFLFLFTVPCRIVFAKPFLDQGQDYWLIRSFRELPHW